MSYEGQISQFCIHVLAHINVSGALRKMIDTAEKAVALLARRDLTGPDDGAADGSTLIQEPESNFFGTSHLGQDARLRFNFEDQRYKKRGAHMHPQGLSSEPDLHSPSER